MEKCIILEGNNKNKLIQQATEHFNVSQEDLDIKIITEKNRIIKKYYKMEFKLSSNLNSYSTDNKENLDELIDEEYLSKLEKPQKDYNIQFTNEGVKVTVNKIKDKKSLYNEIYNYICRKEIKDFDKSKIYEAIDNLHEDIILAPVQNEIIVDDEIIIDISKDNMKGYVEIIPGDEDGKKITYTEALNILEEKIKFGIDNNMLKEIFKSKLYNKKYAIAYGKDPINGEDGYLDYKFDINTDLKPCILDNGRVDFRNLGLVNNISKGQILALINPPTQGEIGFNILGEEISAIEGKPASLKIGKNITINEEEIFSDIDGQVRLTNGKLEVLNIYNIEGNVDSHTGNIDFNGTVVVNNCVNSGFKVEALGDVYVNGVVEDTSVKSIGNIYLARGIVGKNRATLESKGEIVSKYIENATVKAEGDITAQAILHSTAQSNSSINVQGKKGLIVGGECKAQFEVHANIIGSPMETYTLVEVGTNPELKENLVNIKSEIEGIEQDIIKISKSINILDKSYKHNNLSDKKIILFKKLLKTNKQLNEKKKNLIEEYENKEKELKILSTGTIKVDDIIYPGVKIVIGNHSMYIRKPIKNSKFTLVRGTIKVTKL
ncbi:DUF342 domain-containing protein [Clostridium sp. D2Q-11]|uniref:DUF342 domain-containing protein n=1 Tax=Anaeromonas frigoriresistens TaxID=2683708 RepID=A0A942ZA12_9FIRM|nr:FapA family protein [Anaeromonas frigoriresistens]MBS4539873.1 DUF342 domain-containing protein [Anaeromonas frigoriresistens]